MAKLERDKKKENKELIDRLFDLASEKGFNYDELSKAAGVPSSTISSWKHQQGGPKAIDVPHLAKALDVTYQTLLLGEDEKSPTLDRNMIEVEYIVAKMQPLSKKEADAFLDTIKTILDLYLKTHEKA